MEQAILLHPIGAIQGRAPCAAKEEPAGQQWMWLKELQPTESPRRSCGTLCWNSALLNCGPLWQPHTGVVLGELQPMGSLCRISWGRTASCGKDPHRAVAESGHGKVAEMKGYGLTAASIQRSTVQGHSPVLI